MKNAPNNLAIRDALLSLKAKGNAKAYTLVVTAKSSYQIAAEKRQAARQKLLEERIERFNELWRLIDLARIPGMKVPVGYTSRAERVAKELAYLGGAEYQEGLSVLKFARNTPEDWQNALACFGPQQAVLA